MDIKLDLYTQINNARLDHSNLLSGVVSEKAKTSNASQEFYGMFLGIMTNLINEHIEVDPVFGGGSAEKLVRSMLYDQYALEASKVDNTGTVQKLQKAIESYNKAANAN